MKRTALKHLGLAALSFLGLATSAVADGRNPGSLLVYPEFDNRNGIVTLLTVTNTNDLNSTIVEFIYRGKYDANYNDLQCAEFNLTKTLTPNDTFTVITKFHNPDMEQGFVYVFAKDGANNRISFNYLIGNVITLDGTIGFEFSTNPLVYKAIANQGQFTNVDGDTLLDMDGCEYEQGPNEIVIPRFLGQGGVFTSELVLLGLAGGRNFNTTVDFLIYNDNEEVFSKDYVFNCWERVELSYISGIFDNDFLANFTNDDPNELLGAPAIETGWIWMRGAIAQSFNSVIVNPAIYAVLIERIQNKGAADLPFEIGKNGTGDLFPNNNFGDIVDTCNNP